MDCYWKGRVIAKMALLYPQAMCLFVFIFHAIFVAYSSACGWMNIYIYIYTDREREREKEVNCDNTFLAQTKKELCRLQLRSNRYIYIYIFEHDHQKQITKVCDFFNMVSESCSTKLCCESLITNNNNNNKKNCIKSKNQWIQMQSKFQVYVLWVMNRF